MMVTHLTLALHLSHLLPLAVVLAKSHTSHTIHTYVCSVHANLACASCSTIRQTVEHANRSIRQRGNSDDRELRGAWKMHIVCVCVCL